MRTVTITKTYKLYDELTEAEKKKAYEEWYPTSCCYCYDEGYRATLDRFCDIFGITLREWEMDESFCNFIIGSYGDGNITECRGLRLSKYLANNDNYRSKYSGLVNAEKMRDECGLTGYCADYAIFDPIVKARDYKRVYGTFEELIDACLHAFFKEWRDDIAYTVSEEGFAELAKCNEWEFEVA